LGNLTDYLFSDLYLDCLKNFLLLHARTRQATCPISTVSCPNELDPSLESLEDDFRTDCRLAVASKAGSLVGGIVCSFLDYDGPALLDYLFLRTVFKVELPRKIRRGTMLDRVLAEAVSLRGKTFGKREHSWFSESRGKTYFWGRLGAWRPLMSAPFPPELREFAFYLWSRFPCARELPDVLTVLYRGAHNELNYHQDIFGAKVRGRPERVLLFFFGETRTLRFIGASGRNFRRDISCVHGQGLYMTPLANKIWKHAKVPGVAGCLPALTVAFRQGLPLFEMLQAYPIYRKWFPSVPDASITILRSMGL